MLLFPQQASQGETLKNISTIQIEISLSIILTSNIFNLFNPGGLIHLGCNFYDSEYQKQE